MFPACYEPVETLPAHAGGRARANGSLSGVVNRRDVGSWLEGPRAARVSRGSFPGQRLGMPERGPGSVARFGRRAVAILIDWTLCQLVAFAVLGARFGQGGADGLLPLAVFVVENLALVGTVGFTIGHRLLGLRVLRLGGGLPGPLPALTRTVLLALAVPALIWDRDERGLHDKVAGTVLVRR
jgi:uncharacterized RDD family membrane protein YckC